MGGSGGGGQTKEQMSGRFGLGASIAAVLRTKHRSPARSNPLAESNNLPSLPSFQARGATKYVDRFINYQKFTFFFFFSLTFFLRAHPSSFPSFSFCLILTSLNHHTTPPTTTVLLPRAPYTSYSTPIIHFIHAHISSSVELVVRRPGSGIHVRRVGGPVPGVPGDREIGRLGP